MSSELITESTQRHMHIGWSWSIRANRARESRFSFFHIVPICAPFVCPPQPTVILSVQEFIVNTQQTDSIERKEQLVCRLLLALLCLCVCDAFRKVKQNRKGERSESKLQNTTKHIFRLLGRVADLETGNYSKILLSANWNKVKTNLNAQHWKTK